MRSMRARGKVVGSIVMLESPMPDGADVDVVTRATSSEDAESWDASDEEWAEIESSLAEAERGELISAEAVLAELRTLK